MTQPKRKVTPFARGYTGPDDPRFERDSRLLGQVIQDVRDEAASARGAALTEKRVAELIADALLASAAAGAEAASAGGGAGSSALLSGDERSQGEIESLISSSTPSGTGFRHVTNGIEDPAATKVFNDHIVDGQVTFNKMQAIQTARLLGRATTLGQIQQIALGSGLSMSGASLIVQTLTSFLDFQEIAEPASPSADRARVYAVDQNDLTVLEVKTADGAVLRFMRDNTFVAKNDESGGGNTILAGEVVYISGASGANELVKKWIADGSIAADPIGVALTSSAHNGFFRVLTLGKIGKLDTSLLSEGVTLYASPSVAGALTITEPVPPNLRAEIGVVTRSNGSNGEIFVRPLSVRGRFKGTRENSFSIGPATAGAKDLVFLNGSTLTLRANPTGTRTVTLPDATVSLAAHAGDISAGTAAAPAIATNAVTTTKIADSNVTLAKIQDLGAGAVLANNTIGSGPPVEAGLGVSLVFNFGEIVRAALTGDVTAALNGNATTIAANAVTTTKIADANVTKAKIENAAAQGSTLMRVTTGAGPYEDAPTVGTAFPTAFNGRTFVRTDLDYAGFIYDGGRTKWLSYSHTVQFVFTNQATVNVGNALRPFQANIGTATLGPVLPWDATLVSAVAMKNNTSTATDFDIRAGVTSKHSVSLAAGVETGSSTSIDVDFTAGDVINVFIATGNLTNGGGVAVTFRRKAA